MPWLARGQLGCNRGHLEGEGQLWELSGGFVSDLVTSSLPQHVGDERASGGEEITCFQLPITLSISVEQKHGGFCQQEIGSCLPSHHETGAGGF